MEIHIECKPDEILVNMIGFTKKQIRHHFGKSRIFGAIEKLENQIALVDEDPNQAKHRYEEQLIFQNKKDGVSYFLDVRRNNKVFVLKVKLEDWIVAVCKKNNINPESFGLPNKPDKLHSVINNRLPAYKRLLDVLEQIERSPITNLRKIVREN